MMTSTGQRHVEGSASAAVPSSPASGNGLVSPPPSGGGGGGGAPSIRSVSPDDAGSLPASGANAESAARSVAASAAGVASPPASSEASQPAATGAQTRTNDANRENPASARVIETSSQDACASGRDTPPRKDRGAARI